MEPHAPPDPLAIEFIRALLSVAASMDAAMTCLLEAVEDQYPWPGENPDDVLIEMAARSILPALRRVPPEDVECATDLIDAAGERFLADLKLAMEIARRRESMRTR